MKLSKTDLELIKFAESVAKTNSDIYVDKSLHVGCAILAKSGKVYKGINIKSSHSVCAEQIALGQALACGEREFDTIVSVKLEADGSSNVVSPCGLCRYIFDKASININFIVPDVKKDKLTKVNITELLPYPYKRKEELIKTLKNKTKIKKATK